MKALLRAFLDGFTFGDFVRAFVGGFAAQQLMRLLQ